MYQNPIELVEQIYEEAPTTKNVSLEYFAEEIERITGGDKPSRSSVRRWLAAAGIVATGGKKRTWAYKHNPQKGE